MCIVALLIIAGCIKWCEEGRARDAEYQKRKKAKLEQQQRRKERLELQQAEATTAQQGAVPVQIEGHQGAEGAELPLLFLIAFSM